LLGGLSLRVESAEASLGRERENAIDPNRRQQAARDRRPVKFGDFFYWLANAEYFEIKRS
jgi:hypothetical protein